MYWKFERADSYDNNVLLGNDQDAANRMVLCDHKISHVINVTSHVPLYFESDGVCYLRFPASDSGIQNLRQYFEEAIGFIGWRWLNIFFRLVKAFVYILQWTQLDFICLWRFC